MFNRTGAALRRTWWWQLALPAALTAAAWLIQVLVSEELPVWGQRALIGAGTLSALLAFVLPARQLTLERRTRDDAEQIATETLASYKVRVHDMLLPLSLKVGEVLGADDDISRREAQQELKQMVIDFAAENIGPERSRACYYGLDVTRSKPYRRVRLKNWRGRNRPPRQGFKESRPDNALVFMIIDSRDAYLIPDVNAIALPGWDSSGAEYETLICASVSAAEKLFGILTIDSLSVGDLTGEDLDLMRLFAKLLAIGLAAE